MSKEKGSILDEWSVKAFVVRGHLSRDVWNKWLSVPRADLGQEKFWQFYFVLRNNLEPREVGAEKTKEAGVGDETTLLRATQATHRKDFILRQMGAHQTEGKCDLPHILNVLWYSTDTGYPGKEWQWLRPDTGYWGRPWDIRPWNLKPRTHRCW